MKRKHITTSIIITLMLCCGGNLTAQKISVILEELNKLEERLDNLEANLQNPVKLELRLKQLEAAPKKEFDLPHNQFTEVKPDEDITSLAKAVSLLRSQVDRLLEDVELVNAGTNGNRQAELISALEMDADEAMAVFSELMKNYQNSEEAAEVDPETETNSGVKTSEINGLGDLFNATLQNRLNGITLDALYTAEISSNLFGGLRRKTVYLDNVDLTISVNAEELFGWQGATFFLYGLGNNGGSPSENVGDAQTVSNIDAPDTWKVYELWMQQNFFMDKLSVLAGLYDLNSEFDVIETAGLFLNSSHGIGPDFSQAGINGPSIFPATSLSLRAKVQPTDNFYIQGVVLDGIPGNPNSPQGTHIKLDKDDGILISTEVGYITGTSENSDAPYGKIAFGIFYFSTKFDDMLKVDSEGNQIQHKSNPGFYALAEQTVYREKGDPTQGLTLFGRIGFADSKVNQ